MSLAASLAPPIGVDACVRIGSVNHGTRTDARLARARPHRAFAQVRKFSPPQRIGQITRASGDTDPSSSGASVETQSKETEQVTGGRFKRRAPDAAPPKASPLGSGPTATPASTIKVIPVEQRSRDAFQGVAKVDDEDTSVRVVGLVAGDVAALLLFAAIGRGNHGEGLFITDVLLTAAPFMLGWFLSSGVTGIFGDDARGSKAGPAAITAAKGWALGMPTGLILRGISNGQVSPKSFAIVTMVATGVFLIGWRTWFASSSAADNNGNKKGNPLEFMSLLMSLTKRW